MNGPVANNYFDNTTLKGLVYSADSQDDILMEVYPVVILMLT